MWKAGIKGTFIECNFLSVCLSVCLSVDLYGGWFSFIVRTGLKQILKNVDNIKADSIEVTCKVK